MNGSKKSDRARKGPPRFEIGKMYWEQGNFKFPVLDRQGNPTYERNGEPATRAKPGFRFWLLAVGEQGRYTAGNSVPFEGLRGETRAAYYVQNTDSSRKSLDDFINKLWKEGWQPTSFGQFWHDLTFRRMIPEPVDPAEEAEEALAPFRKVEAKYSKIRADFAAGRLNPEQYRGAVQKLTVQDASGRQWMIDGQSGRWLLFDGQNWKPGDPAGD